VAWTRRWRIDSRRRLIAIAGLISHTLVSEGAPLELILRTERKEKSHEQRKLFHAVCADIAPHWGLTPAGVKLKVKADFYGVDIKLEGETYYAVVQSSEDSDRAEYARLIDHAYQLAAESGHHIQDRRPTFIDRGEVRR